MMDKVMDKISSDLDKTAGRDGDSLDKSPDTPRDGSSYDPETDCPICHKPRSETHDFQIIYPRPQDPYYQCDTLEVVSSEWIEKLKRAYP
jgi:hypothetical protein